MRIGLVDMKGARGGGGSKVIVSLMKVKPVPNRLFPSINFRSVLLPGDFWMHLRHH
jgi:hypothetical protein